MSVFLSVRIRVAYVKPNHFAYAIDIVPGVSLFPIIEWTPNDQVLTLKSILLTFYTF